MIGYLEEADDQAAGTGFGRFQRLGDLGDLEVLIKTETIDEVYIALSGATQHNLEPLIERCRVHGVRFRAVPDLLEAQFGRMEIHPLAGIPLVTLSDNAIVGFKYVQKRALDIVVSLVGLILSAPLWLVIAIAIRLDSRGPVLFRQTRIGKDGAEFALFKFRSMVHDAEALKLELIADGPHPALFKIRDDSRRTRLGRVLRRMSLDELPQLLNVLTGSMSLVGPASADFGRSGPVRRLGAAPAAGASRPHRSLAGQRSQQPPLRGDGDARYLLRRELVAQPGPEDPGEDNPRRTVGPRRLLSAPELARAPG